MSLTNQIVEKIRLNLDKPATSLNFKHATELINKEVVPVEQLLPLLLYKYRADLILFVLQRFAITAEELEGLLASVVKNILKYQLQDVKKIWKQILQKEIFKMWRQKWGVQKIMHEAFKIANQTIKETLFELLISNIEVMLQLNETKTVEGFVKNYTANYLKYNIYLPPVPLLATQCLMINANAQFKILDSQTKKQLLQRTLVLLNATSQRKVYTYQNNCMSFVALLMKEQEQSIADMLDIHECEKVLELYLYNKPTREQARKMQQVVQKYLEKIVKEQRDKMDYNYQAKQNNEESKLNQKKMPLIENVIDKTNEYQLRQRMGIVRSQISVSPSRPKSNNFLKKGIGNGGGKAQVSTYKSPSKVMKCSSAIQQLVENCFFESESKIGVSSPSRTFSNMGRNSRLNNPKDYVEVEDNDKTVSVYQSSIEDGEQWTEISNLIDLAYQYKFG